MPRHPLIKPHTYIYAIVLIAVLGIVSFWEIPRRERILIGRNRTNDSRIIESHLPAGEACEAGEAGKNKDNKPDQSNIALPDINSTRSAKVIRVLDGDTIEVENGQRVRYLGINAPESGQPFSTAATRENERLVGGRIVNLEFDVQAQDRYGRLLAYIWIGDVLINKEIVKNGYAASGTIQPNVKYQDLILKAQQEARENCRGLWLGLCSQKSESSCVKIVNINANAPGNDNFNKNGEWIEIKNTCSQAISMKDWLLKDSSAGNKYEFSDYTLESARSVIIYSGCGANTQDKLFWQCPEGKYAIWNNTGDHAFLYDASANLITEYQY